MLEVLLKFCRTKKEKFSSIDCSPRILTSNRSMHFQYQELIGLSEACEMGDCGCLYRLSQDCILKTSIIHLLVLLMIQNLINSKHLCISKLTPVPLRHQKKKKLLSSSGTSQLSPSCLSRFKISPKRNNRIYQLFTYRTNLISCKRSSGAAWKVFLFHIESFFPTS